jgi:hypothetical protein
MSCPLSGTTTPGTPSHRGFAPSSGIDPLIDFTGMVRGWLTARGIPPAVKSRLRKQSERSRPTTSDRLVHLVNFI